MKKADVPPLVLAEDGAGDEEGPVSFSSSPKPSDYDAGGTLREDTLTSDNSDDKEDPKGEQAVSVDEVSINVNRSQALKIDTDARRTSDGNCSVDGITSTASPASVVSSSGSPPIQEGGVRRMDTRGRSGSVDTGRRYDESKSDIGKSEEADQEEGRPMRRHSTGVRIQDAVDASAAAGEATATSSLPRLPKGGTFNMNAFKSRQVSSIARHKSLGDIPYQRTVLKEAFNDLGVAARQDDALLPPMSPSLTSSMKLALASSLGTLTTSIGDPVLATLTKVKGATTGSLAATGSPRSNLSSKVNSPDSFRSHPQPSPPAIDAKPENPSKLRSVVNNSSTQQESDETSIAIKTCREDDLQGSSPKPAPKNSLDNSTVPSPPPELNRTNSSATEQGEEPPKEEVEEVKKKEKEPPRTVHQMDAMNKTWIGYHTMLNPHSLLRGWIDAIIWVLIFYSLFIVTFSAAFLGTAYKTWASAKAVEQTIDVLFCADVVLEFFTAHFNQKLEGYVVDRHYQAMRYLKGHFFCDFISSFPFEIFTQEYRHYVRLMKLLRLTRLRYFGRGAQVINTRVMGQILRLVTLFFHFMLLTHSLGCAGFGISHGEDFEPSTWASQLYLEEASTFSQYLRSLFYALTLTTGIGNTPVPPVLNSEVAFVSVAMITGSAFWAYAVGMMFDLISSINKDINVYEDNLDQLKYWMEYKSLPGDLKQTIIRHFNYQWSRHHFIDENVVMSNLSPALQLKLRRYLCRDIVSSVPIFKNTPATFIDDIVGRLRAKFVPTGEIVCNQGEMGHEMFILSKGRVEVLKVEDPDNRRLSMNRSSGPNSKKDDHRISEPKVERITVLESGSFFGEVSMIYEVPRISTCRAITQCDLFALSKTDFYEVMETHPMEYSKISQIANQRAIMTVGTDLEEEALSSSESSDDSQDEDIDEEPSYGGRGSRTYHHNSGNRRISQRTMPIARSSRQKRLTVEKEVIKDVLRGVAYRRRMSGIKLPLPTERMLERRMSRKRSSLIFNPEAAGAAARDNPSGLSAFNHEAHSALPHRHSPSSHHFRLSVDSLDGLSPEVSDDSFSRSLKERRPRAWSTATGTVDEVMNDSDPRGSGNDYASAEAASEVICEAMGQSKLSNEDKNRLVDLFVAFVAISGKGSNASSAAQIDPDKLEEEDEEEQEDCNSQRPESIPEGTLTRCHTLA